MTRNNFLHLAPPVTRLEVLVAYSTTGPSVCGLDPNPSGVAKLRNKERGNTF